MPFFVLNILVGVFTLFIITLCYGGNIVNKLISVVLIFMCLCASETVMAGVSELADIHISDNVHNGDAFSYIGISIILGVIYEIINSFQNINTNISLPKAVNITIVILNIIIWLMEIVIFSQENLIDSVKVISVICMLIVIFLIIYLYDTLSRYYVKRIQLEAIEREKNYYMKQSELLEESNNGIKELRHNMKNQLYVIASLINERNTEAKEYIENITEKLEKTKIYSSSGNLALDSIINYKLTKAVSQNIQVYSTITIPSNIQGATNDLVTIIGNLLDNAIEASENLTGDKYIKITIKYKKGIMFIEVKNKFDGIITQKDGELATKKADKVFHGIGLKSVKSTVNNYNGTVNVEFDEEEFRVNVMVYIS